MKKLMFALLAVCMAGTAGAQKNSILAFGDAHFATKKDDMGGGSEHRSLNWGINPAIGYQFTKNITLGVQGGYNSMWNENRNSPAINSWDRVATEKREWHAGVFFRYTHNLNKTFSVFDQINLSYFSGEDATETENRAVTGGTIVNTTTVASDVYNGFQASWAPMIMAHVYKGFALNFGFGGLAYRTYSYDVAPTTGSEFMFTFGQQFNFGISQNFSCHCKKGHMKPGDDLRPMKMDMSDDEDEE